MKYVPLFIKRLGAPARYYQWSGTLLPWLSALTIIGFLAGLYGGLVLAPADYQQGESYRIMFVHVPAAWMSLFVYVLMTVAAIIALIWRIKVAEVIVACSAPLGASFTFIALCTGMLWGKPMWGTYWVWDARLTSELLLLFIYLGIMALESSIEDKRKAARACSLLTIVGSVNIPIIHYSVVWWNTLHQGSIFTDPTAPSVHPSMLIPLLIMAIAFKLYFFTVLLMQSRAELLSRERHANWIDEVLTR